VRRRRVARIDRPARSQQDLQDIGHGLRGCSIALKATEPPIETPSGAGEAFLALLSAFAGVETNLRQTNLIPTPVTIFILTACGCLRHH
jgi:DNA invertase Pin-like site-specific DNA recombinase